MNVRRRTVVATIATTATGCVGLSSDQSSPTATGPTQDCPLNHELFDTLGDRRIADRYEYNDLSPAAQSAVNGTLTADGDTYRVNRRRAPAPFRYTDVVTYYVIRRNDTQYVIGTWSGEGC